jgi:hypothetical protein
MTDCFRLANEAYGESSENWDVGLKIQAECACDPASECEGAEAQKAIEAMAPMCCNPVYGVEDWASFVGDSEVCNKLDVDCDEESWPDKDHGLVCGKCKVLVDRFSERYHNCNGYCSAIGRECTGAWDEEGDSCRVQYEMSCDQHIGSSDAICECDGGLRTIAGLGYDGQPPSCISECVAQANQRFSTDAGLLAEYCKCAAEAADRCDGTSARHIAEFLGGRCEDPSLPETSAGGPPSATVRCVKSDEPTDLEHLFQMRVGWTCRQYYESIKHADHRGLRTDFGYDCRMGYFCSAQEMAALGFVPADQRESEEFRCLGNNPPPEQHREEWQKKLSCPFMLNTLMLGWEWEWHSDKYDSSFENYYYYDGGVTPWMKNLESHHTGHCMRNLHDDHTVWFGEQMRGVTLCDICCDTCAEAGQSCAPPPGGCVKAGWKFESADCPAGEVAERTCPSFDGAHGLGKAGWEWKREWMIPSDEAGRSPEDVLDAGEVEPVEVRTEFSLSASGFEKMLESKRRAV